MGNSKQQVLVDQIRRRWTGQGLGGSPAADIGRAMGKICGKQTKAETKQLGARKGRDRRERRRTETGGEKDKS